MAASLALLVAPAGGAPDCSIDWDGGGTDALWSTPENWDHDELPTQTDTACIPDGAAVTVNADASVASVQSLGTLTVTGGTLELLATGEGNESNATVLNLSGGELAGPAELIVSQSLDWTAGTMSGLGRTVLEDHAEGTIDPGPFGSVALTGGRTFENRNQVTWLSGGISVDASFIVNTQMFLVHHGTTIASPAPASTLLTNSGTIDKTSAGVDSQITIPLANSGRVMSDSGTLSLTGGGSGAGAFGDPTDDAAAKTVSFDAGNWTLEHGAALDYGVRISGATVSVDTGTTVNAADLRLAAGTLGGAGTAVISKLVWTGGVMSGTGDTVLPPGSTAWVDPGAFSGVYLERPLTNSGTFTWTTGGIEVSGPGIVNTGTILANAESTLYAASSATPTLTQTSTGVLEKADGTGATSIWLPIANGGLVKAGTGVLSLIGGGTGPGDFAGTAGQIQLNGGTWTLEDGSALTGSIALNTGELAVAPATTAESSGLLAVNAGSLTGAGTLKITGSLVWVGGTMNGPGTTWLTGTGTLDAGPFGVALTSGRTFLNGGTLDWVSGSFVLEGSNLVNTGTFNANSENALHPSGPDPSVFTNAGTFRKSAGTGTTHVSTTLVNSGAVVVESGIVALSGGGSGTGSYGGDADSGVVFNGGTTTLGAGASLPGRVSVQDGARLNTAAGANVLSSSVFRHNPFSFVGGEGTLTLSGTFEWFGGVFDGSATTRLTAAAVGTVESPVWGVAIRDDHTVENDGDLTWISGYFGIGDTAELANRVGGVFDARADGAAISPENSGGSITNAGLFSKTAGEGNTFVNVPVANSGQVSATVGNIVLGGGGTGTGSYGGDADSGVVFNGGTTTLSAGASLPGRVSVQDGARLNTAAGANVLSSSVFRHNPFSFVGGEGTLTLSGTFEWFGGELDGSATTRLTDAATGTVDSPVWGVAIRGDHTLENGGDLTWLNGYFGIGGTAELAVTPSGAFLAHAEGQTMVAETSTAVVSNAGLIGKSVGTGNAGIAVPVANAGAVQATAGNLILYGGGSGTGSYGGDEDSAVVFGGGTTTLGSGASLPGRVAVQEARLDVAAGAVVPSTSLFRLLPFSFRGGPGTLTISDTFDWAGGQLDGSGTTRLLSSASGEIASPVWGAAIRGGHTLENEGSLSLLAGYFGMGGTARLLNDAGATFDVVSTDGIADEGDTPSIRNDGLVRKAVATGSGVGPTFDNAGTVRVAAGVLHFVDLANYSSASKALSGGTWDVSGILRFNGADIFINGATLILDGPESQVTDEFGNDAFRSFIRNSLSLSLENGRDLTTPAAFANRAELKIGLGSEFATTGDYIQEWLGTLGTTDLLTSTSAVTANGGSVRINTGVLRGVGTAAPNLVVGTSGVVSPGLSAGKLHVTGPYQSSGTLRAEIGGTVAGTDYDQVEATGAATLGTLVLEISFQPGYVPALGDTFALVSASSVDHDLLELNAPPLPPELAYHVTSPGGQLLLSVVNASGVSVDDASANEGSAVEFPLELVSPEANDVTVNYTLTEGTAHEPEDYTGVSGSTTIPAGATGGTISVPTVDDTVDEGPQTFTLQITSAGGLPVLEGTATGTITDNDPAPEITVDSILVNEGDAGTTATATFTASLAAPSELEVTANWTTEDDTAVAPGDYQAGSGSLTFAPGVTEQEFAVTVNGDDATESNERFAIQLSDVVNATPTDVPGEATILDDDAPSGADLEVFKADAPDPVGTGGELSYFVDITNHGPSDAQNVVITDTLAAGTTVVSVSAPDGVSCDTDENPIVCTAPTLEVGDWISLLIVVTAPATPGTITNEVTASSATPDPNGLNNSASEDTTVAPAADLAITKTSTPTSVSVGENFTYTITVTNDGPQAATGVTVHDSLPDVELVTNDPACVEAAHELTCDLGTVAMGSPETIEVVVKSLSSGEVFNTATVDGSVADPNSSNNNATATTLVTARNDLKLTKTSSPDRNYVGQQIAFGLTVENIGLDAATGVVVTDDLPDGLTFVSAPGCSELDGTVTCGVASLAAGATASFTVTALGASKGVRTNTAHVTADQTDEHPANNAASTTVYVREPALDLARAMITNEDWLLGASFVTDPPREIPNEVGTGPLASFPVHGANYAVLTTGKAEFAGQENTSDSTGSNDGGENVRGNTDYDVTVLKVDLDVPSGMNCLSVGFRFLSDEYPEFVGSAYNDALIMEWGSSTWTTSGSTISAPGNFAFDPTNNVISINATGVTSMTAANAVGTTYDGATPLLSASKLVSPGQGSLYISIFDQGDPILDSAAFVDRLNLASVAPEACTSGATVLSVAKTADAPTTAAGGQNGYTITIPNPAAEALTLTSITDDLPPGFTYRTGTTTGATTAEPSVVGQQLTWNGPFTVPAAGSLTLHFGVNVSTTPGDYLNNASAEGDGIGVSPSGPTAKITVQAAPNTGPVVNAGPDASVDEGELWQQTGSFTDPDANTWNALVDYGDGGSLMPLTINPDKTFQLSHRYKDNGVYTVTIKIGDGTTNGEDTVVVTVGNLPPTLDLGPDAAMLTGQGFERGVAYDDPGEADTHTATVDYGDGSGVAPLALTQASRTLFLSVTYMTPGTYTITVVLTDDDGGTTTDTMLVVVTEPCEPVVRTLSNGDVATADGALAIQVDGLGAFGSAVSSGGQARFNPPGPLGAASTTFTSNLYTSENDRLLEDTCADGEAEVLASSPTLLETRKTVGPIQLQVLQQLAPIADGSSSTLTQTYTITNTSPDPIPALSLVRHVDGDLLFDGTLQDGGGATADGSSLFEFDSSDDPANPSTFVGITGALGGDAVPDRWTIQPYDYRPDIRGSDGIPDADNAMIHNDANGDRIVDTPYDVTLSQQWNTALAPGAAITFTTATRFGQRPPNVPPDAVADAATTAEDSAADITVLGNDTDADGDPVDAVSFTQAAHGTVTLNPDDTFHYVPQANFNGTDSFTYTVSDGRGGSDTATVTITVTPVNDAPVASDSSETTAEDTALSSSAVAVDVDGGSLSFSLESAAPAGLVFSSDGSFTYTPPLNFHGVVSFDFRASDGTLDSEVATVTITVTPVNDRPVAQAESYETDEDVTLNVAAPGVLANDSDLDGDTLTTFLQTEPLHGTLTLNPNGSFSYAPNPNFHGTDSFQYRANDGLLISTPPTTVTITVRPVNDAPIAADASRSTAEDTTLNSSVPAALDVESDALTYAVVTGLPGLTLNANGSFTYTPPTDFHGTKTFTYKANDGALESNIATVTITVDPVNDAPVAADDAKSTPEDTPLVASVPPATDVDSASLTYQTVDPVPAGLEFEPDGSYVYTPAANFHGTVTFQYRASDGALLSNIATVTITVSSVNDPPVAADDSETTPEDTLLTSSVAATDVDGDTLSFTVVGAGLPGLAFDPDGSYTYTSPTNFHGEVSFQFKANDGTTDSNTATVTITVTPVNDTPLAADDAAVTTEGLHVDVNVLANDTDVDGNTLTVGPFGQGANGAVTLAAGKLRYTPNAGFTGTDTFTYRANDGTVDSNLATVTITVQDANFAPVAIDDAAATDEDTPVNVDVLANDTDADGNSLSIHDFTQPANGTVALVSGELRYTPAANFHGTDTFTYRATDGPELSGSGTVTITVAPVNDAPVASDSSEGTAEDTPLTASVSASDADGDALTYAVVGASPTGLSFDTSDGSYTYTPPANFNGTASFDFKANDSILDSNTATVTITVTPVNDAPVAADDSRTTAEDTALSASVPAATDVDGPSLTYHTVGAIPAGLVFDDDGDYTYTPPSNFNGMVSFQYRASDGLLDSNTATVTIQVTPVNDAPVAHDAARSTDEDTTLSSSVPAASDPDGGPLTYAVVADLPGLTLNANGSFTYTPPADFHGTKTFTYKANDGTADSNVATITITVNPVNDAPVASDSSQTTAEDTPLTASVSANDVDGDILSFVAVGPPLAGLALNANGSYTYTPPANFHGPASFQFKANDGTLDSNVATVTITVTPVNDAPTAAADAATTTEGVQVDVDVLANDADVDGDTLAVGTFTQATNGSVAHEAGKLRYTPNAGFTGTDTFTYRASDGALQSAETTVTITVQDANFAPVAADDAATTVEDAAVDVDVLGNDTDADGDALTVGPFSQGANGTVALVSGKLRYTPAANFHGTDTFTYRASDGIAESNLATVTITVTALNDAPVASDSSETTAEDTALSSSAVATDVDGGSLSFSLESAAPAGLVYNSDGSFTYTPPLNFHGVVSFDFRASDGTLDSEVATVTITVTPVNDRPVAQAESYETDEDVTLNVAAPGVLANDSDLDGDTLTTFLQSGPTNGTLTLNPNGSFSYVPNPNFHGTDSFQYRANDGLLISTPPTTVTITVRPANDAPIAADASRSTAEDTTLNSSVPAALDVESDALTYAVVTGLPGLTFTANGSFTYVPPADFHGTKTFTYKANDGTADSNVATITITVNPVNDAPVASDSSQTTAEDTPLTASVSANDVDGDILSFVAVGPPLAGLALNANGSYTYTPPANFHGPASFQFKANDGTLDSNVATVTITVTPVNDAPTAAGDAASTDQGIAVDVDVLANDGDVDGPALSIGPFGQGGNGSVALAGGKLRYTPNAGFSGTDSFTYRASDGSATSNLATVTVTVRSTTPNPDVCTITGTAGPDTLPGTESDDVICGLGGDDRIDGRGGNDVIRGGPGADIADGSAGNDTILGETGNDTVLDGGEGNDTLNGGPGHDKLVGDLGDDQLVGEAGRDWLLPGAGNDSVDGGADNDKADYKAAGGPVQLDLAAGTATGDGTDSLASVENALGSAFADLIDGSDADNELAGYNGNDRINGRGGDDFLDGGRNTDACDQGAGSGTIVNCEGRQAAGAASTSSASATFGGPNQVATQTIAVTPGSPSFTAAFAWESPGAAFSVTAEVVQPSGALFSFAGFDKTKPKKRKAKPKKRAPVKLRISVRRGTTYMTVTGSVPKRLRVRGAKIRFKLKALSVTERTTVSTTVRQPRR